MTADGRLSSMEPRLGSRGKLRVFGSMSAIPSLQWSRDLEVAERQKDQPETEQPPGAFNGAATWKSRKAEGKELASSATRPLQWSRDLEVAERKRSAFFLNQGPSFNGAATWKSRKGQRRSLAPWFFCPILQWSRDLEVAESFQTRFQPDVSDAFNGAATWKSRKGKADRQNRCL